MATSARKRRKPADPEGSQVDRCYLWLRDALSSCEIAPGTRFTGRELMARTGFGRTPMREALLRLQQEGLVVALPRSGYEATVVTEKTVNDLFDLWRLIGPLIARLAFSRMTPEIREQLRSQEEFTSSGSLQKQQQISTHVFELLAEATQNEDLIYIQRRLSANLRRVFTLFLLSDLGTEWAAQRMSPAKLALSTDPDAVAAEIADAIAVSYRGIMQLLRQRDNPPPVATPPPRASRRLPAKTSKVARRAVGAAGEKPTP